jgi:hypothetical protein
MMTAPATAGLKRATAGAGKRAIITALSAKHTQRGRIAFAELIDGELRIRVFGPDEICTTEPNVPHNVYLYRDTVIHTVKHGDEGSVADWHADPSLDEKVDHLNEADIARLAPAAIPR